MERIKKVLNLIMWRPKGWKNILLNQWAAMRGKVCIPSLPTLATIEVASICNLRCPVCETGSEQLNRAQGLMSFENFKKIIDKIYRYINTIFLYWMGEPFLNPHIYKMIEYAKHKKTYVVVCTNGEILNATTLIKSGLDEIQFQIAGVSQEAHSKYRVGSHIENISKNIKEVIAERKERNKKHPKIILGLIVTKYSESEIPKFFNWAKTVGVDETMLIKLWVRNYQQAKEFLPTDEKYWIYSRNAFDKGELKIRSRPKGRCYHIWHSVTINWEGDILPCCVDANNRYGMGNILDDNLINIWNNKKYQDFRRKIFADQLLSSLCRLCPGFGVPQAHKF